MGLDAGWVMRPPRAASPAQPGGGGSGSKARAAPQPQQRLFLLHVTERKQVAGLLVAERIRRASRCDLLTRTDTTAPSLTAPHAPPTSAQEQPSLSPQPQPAPDEGEPQAEATTPPQPPSVAPGRTGRAGGGGGVRGPEHAERGCAAELGVRVVWVAAAQRRRGVATSLLNAARCQLLPGGFSVVPADRVAFAAGALGGVGGADGAADGGTRHPAGGAAEEGEDGAAGFARAWARRHAASAAEGGEAQQRPAMLVYDDDSDD